MLTHTRNIRGSANTAVLEPLRLSSITSTVKAIRRFEKSSGRKEKRHSVAIIASTPHTTPIRGSTERIFRERAITRAVLRIITQRIRTGPIVPKVLSNVATRI